LQFAGNVAITIASVVVGVLEDGLSTRDAAARFSIGIATAGAWGRLKRSQGEVRPAKQGKPKGSMLDGHGDFILGALREKPDLTLDELVERLAAERGVRVVRTAVWKLLDRHDQTHKKRPRSATEQGRPDVKAARERWFDDQLEFDAASVVFIR
jgi:transposase